MTFSRVGSCSICGGSVMGERGVWLCVLPPPPDRCSQCGAVAAADVIQMKPAPFYDPNGRSNFFVPSVTTDTSSTRFGMPTSGGDL